MTTPAKPATRTRHSLEIDTDAFWRSHGRGPRGRGGWLFQMEDEDGRQIDAGHPVWGEIYAANGSYAEALKAAKAAARRLGACSITVLP